MNKILLNIFIIFMAVRVSYSQTTVVNVDSSNTVNIYNNGTLIENNQGTVNIGRNKTEKLEMPKEDLGKITDSEDDGIHYVYTDDYKFAGDKVRINGKVYRNNGISKYLTGHVVFKLINNDAFLHGKWSQITDITIFNNQFVKNKKLYVSKYTNSNDDYYEYILEDDLNPLFEIHSFRSINGVIIGYTPKFAYYIGIFMLFVVPLVLIWLSRN